MDLQKFKCYSLLFKSCMKTKRSEFFAENKDMQKLTFLKTIQN